MSNSIATGVAYQDPEFTTCYASQEIGYTAAAQGSVTQATDKSTGVTLNKSAGKITMNNAALAANTAVSFTLTNSVISGNDAIIVNVSGGGTAGAYCHHLIGRQLLTMLFQDFFCLRRGYYFTRH